MRGLFINDVFFDFLAQSVLTGKSSNESSNVERHKPTIPNDASQPRNEIFCFDS